MRDSLQSASFGAFWLLFFVLIQAVPAQDLTGQAATALRKAVAFYHSEVATEGGYHFSYAADLSYGRSESAEGPTQVSVQRAGTPGVGMAFLRAYDATGERTHLDAARDAALALVKGQLFSGGWHYVIEFDPAKRHRYAYRADGNPASGAFNVTTLDDNTTQGAVRVLMRVDRELEFSNRSIHDAAEFALGKLIEAQYPNGAWPQRFERPPEGDRFPVRKASYPKSWLWEWPEESYYERYTFNDNTIPDMIDMFLEAARIYDEPKYLAAAERGGKFILLAQMPEPQPAWAQQYDLEMHPAWARRFEPPAVTGGESQGIMRTLLVLYRETGRKEYLEAIRPALDYLRRSVLTIAPEPSEAYRRASRDGGPVLARFYELRTNRPLYITKGTQIRIPGMATFRPDGYRLSYAGESVITHYGVLTSAGQLERIAQEYEELADENPMGIRRPGKLFGLSPWNEPAATFYSESVVRKIIAAQDERGAWVEEGYIGKANSVVSVFAARDMVVKVAGQVIPIHENDEVEIFDGPQPPRGTVVDSATFARNVEMLASYLR